MLLTIAIVLFVLWLLGFSLHLAIGLQTILVIAAIVALLVYIFNHTSTRVR